MNYQTLFIYPWNKNWLRVGKQKKYITLVSIFFLSLVLFSCHVTEENSIRFRLFFDYIHKRKHSWSNSIFELYLVLSPHILTLAMCSSLSISITFFVILLWSLLVIAYHPYDVIVRDLRLYVEGYLFCISF
jgi:hypothetical protein